MSNASYLIKGVFEVNLNQFKKLLLLKTGQSIHMHLPEQYLQPLALAYRDAAQAISPLLPKDSLKTILSELGERYHLESCDRGLLLPAA